MVRVAVPVRPSTLTTLPVTIRLAWIRCEEETDEVGSDEPYMLVTAVDLDQLVPGVETVLYGPFGDVDQGETHAAGSPPFWSLDNTSPKSLSDPNDVIFVGTMMENDDGDPTAKRTLVKAAAVSSIGASNGMSRANRVRKLVADINGAVGIPTGAPNFDDRIKTQELRFTREDLRLGAIKSHVRDFHFRGDGGHYVARFEIRGPNA